MQCRNCSGNEFTTTSSGNYKCVYCGTLFHEEKPAVFNRVSISTARGFLPLIAVLILITAISIVSVKSCAPATDTKTESVESAQTFTNDSKLPQPKGEIVSVDAIPDIIGNVYFVVICRNSGEIAIERPSATIRLFSGKNEKVASGTGYAFRNRLNPGEVTPVLILVTKCPPYSSHQIEFKPELPYLIPEGGVFRKRFTGTFSDISLRQVSSANGHTLRGKIKNTAEYDALYVQVAAVLYDKNNKVTGYGSAFINEKTLKPGNWDFFDINFTTVKSTPDHYTLFYDAIIH